VDLSNPSDDFEAIKKATQQFQGLRYKHWIEHDVFSLTWWFLLVIAVVPWMVWWKLADKKRLTELVCFGAITALISVLLDSIGTVNSWWMYKDELLIHFPGLLVADISDIPVAYMLAYQYCSTWKPFLIVMGIIALLFSFAIEPALRVMKVYQPLAWEHFYSFIIYMLMGIIVRFIVLRLQPAN
jgi:hypothetical protein